MVIIMKSLVNRYKEVVIDIVLAVPIGILIGALDALFGRVLLKVTDLRNQYVVWLVPFLAIAGILIIFLYKKFNEECLKGMTLVLQTGLEERDRIPKMLIPLVMVCTWITHLFGGSAGREGVAVQLGATVAHSFGRFFKRPDNSRILLITGMAAGFAGLFQTPIAATLFAMEVIVVGAIQYDSLLPALTAAFISSETSHLLGLEKFYIEVNQSLTWNIDTIWKIVLVAICFGVAGGAFAYLLKLGKAYFTKLLKNPMLRIAVMGAGLSVLLLLFHTGRYSGLGTNLINDVFNGNGTYGYDWLLKIVFTVLTLAAGFQGGEVTPLFSIGASLGAVLAVILGLPVMLIAALGYAAVFGSATKTLLAPMLIGAEVFGPQNIIYFAIVCSIAFAISGNHSIYGAQIRINYFNQK
jgi:H+/Cl- antiporter ClcA